MGRTKIDYGIDLGTTNSAIARMENGEPVIKKTDLQSDTMPSCIRFNKKQSVEGGEAAFTALRQDRLKAMMKWTSGGNNIFIEFKRTMGTEKKYPSSHMNHEYSSEELSAEVLKKLKSFIADDELKSIVVTVPAKFTINQKDSTAKAAKLAGFQHCELLQEPIAASMAYGLDSSSKDGFWLVFDFGGGTFDAALLKVEDGIMKVIDTDGDNHLGGKNLDYAIVDEIIVPYLKDNFSIDSILEDDVKREVLREAMKFAAEEAKIQLSFNETHNILSDLGDIPGEDDEGNEFELDITVSQDDLIKVVVPFFQKATDICKELLKRNNIDGTNLGALILVGGPTYSPILRKMLKEQVTDKVDISIDPMICVAKGAALFASTVDVSEQIIEESRDKTKIQLSIGYEPTTVELQEFVTIKTLKEKTEGGIPDKVLAEVVSADTAWSSGKVAINETGEVVEVLLSENKLNSFNVIVYNEQGDRIPNEPSEFTIIQGSKVVRATLPYSIGIEIKSRATDKIVFRSIKPGLEKNQSLPATGVANGLKTQKDIRPGIKEDIIKIPIYQGENDAEGSRAIYNEHVADVIVSGEDLPALLPKGSDVDLTISADRSEILSISAFIPALEYSHEVPKISVQKSAIEADWLESEIQKAEQTLDLINQEETYTNKEELEKLSKDIAEIHKRFDQGRGDFDRKVETLGNLRKCLRKLDDIQDVTEWPKIEGELKEAFYSLEDTYKEFEGKLEGLDEGRIKDAIQQFKEQIPKVIKEQNPRLAAELTKEIRGLRFAVLDEGMGANLEIGLLNDFNRDFDIHDWSDPEKARMLINQGLKKAQNEPSKEKLRPIVIELYKLLPSWDKKIPFSDDTVLTD
ncbi:Hsp70 family protein [Thermodesulfobacteriota bacterium]